MKIIVAFFAASLMLFYGLTARSFGAEVNEWCVASQDVPASFTIAGVSAILRDENKALEERNDTGLINVGTVVKVQYKDSKQGVAAVVPVYSRGTTLWVEYPTKKYWDCSFEQGE